MHNNMYEQLRQLIPQPPLQVGDVTAVASGAVTVELPGGVHIRARGQATVGQKVFVRNGVIESIAPNLRVEIVDV